MGLLHLSGDKKTIMVDSNFRHFCGWSCFVGDTLGLNDTVVALEEDCILVANYAAMYRQVSGASHLGKHSAR